MSVRIQGGSRVGNPLKLIIFAAGISAVILGGCATPSAESKRMKAAREEPIPSAAEPAQAEQTSPQRQETLAAVEEFLARTQEYRLAPVQEAVKTPAKPTTPVVESVQVSKSQEARSAQAVHVAAPKDAAYANAQISIGDSAPPPASQAIPAVEAVTIRASSAKTMSSAVDDPMKRTNSPLELATAQRNDAAETLLDAMRGEWKEKHDAVAEWKLRAMLLALGRDDEAAAIGESGPTELKGILPAWTAASTEIRNLVRGRDYEVDRVLEHVDVLRNALTDRSGPRVKNVALCRKVLTYGSYEEMATEEFVSGRSIQTIVYAEIDNLRAVPEAGGLFETKLSTRLEVLTAEGKSMWQREEPEVVDRCRNPRRDFFVAQRVTLPPTLPVGEYVMKVHVEDKASGRIAEQPVSFSIRSPVSVAKGQ